MVLTGEAILTQMRKGVLEFCVLAHLQNRPSYGLEIASSMARHRHLFASAGTLYPLLARLRRQGWVETTWRQSPSGPPRRYYTLTPDGIASLDAFSAVWPEFRRGVQTVVEEVA